MRYYHNCFHLADWLCFVLVLCFHCFGYSIIIFYWIENVDYKAPAPFLVYSHIFNSLRRILNETCPECVNIHDWDMFVVAMLIEGLRCTRFNWNDCFVLVFVGLWMNRMNEWGYSIWKKSSTPDDDAANEYNHFTERIISKLKIG